MYNPTSYDPTPNAGPLGLARRFHRAKLMLDATSPGLGGPLTPDLGRNASMGGARGNYGRDNSLPTGGFEQSPPGAMPGTKDYWDWYSKKFNQDQFSPGGTMSEILTLGKMAGGFKDPLSVLGRTPANMWSIGRRAFGQGTNLLGSTGFAPGSNPIVKSPGVSTVGPDFSTLDRVIKSGSDLGLTAANMIPDQPVRSIGDVSKELYAQAPGATALMGAVDPLLAGIQSDAEAGKGLMGIPSSQVEKMQAQNVAEANLAQESALRNLGVDAAAAGTYGQPNYDAQVAAEYANQYAPALISAVQQPEELSYKLGPEVMNALTGAVSGVEVPMTKLATSTNLEDLQRQLQAGSSRADVYGRLAGEGLRSGSDLTGTQLRSGQDAANLDAKLNMDAQTANLDAWLKQFGTLAPFAYGSPWKGYSTASGAIGDQNQLVQDLVDKALREAGSLRELHNKRQQQNKENVAGLVGGLTGGLGQLAGGFTGGGGNGFLSDLGSKAGSALLSLIGA